VTTADLQAGLPGGFDASAWGIVPGQSYPYLLWQFASGATPQVVSGIVYKDAGSSAARAGLSVSGLADGSALVSELTGGDVSTGANGYYYYLLAPGTLDATSDVLTYVQASGTQPDGAALADNTGTGVTGLDIYGNALHVVTASTALSAVPTGLLGALGSDPTATTLVNGLGTLHIDARGAFDLNVSDALSGNLVLNSDTDNDGDGGITQSAVVVVGGTSQFDANTGAITLADVGNDFGGVVDLTGGGVTLSDMNALTLGNVQATSLGVSSQNALDLGSSTVTGTLVAESHGGSITQSGSLLVGGTSTLDAGGGAITLADVGNDFGGAVDLTGGAVTLSDMNALTLGSVQATSLDVTSGGNLALTTDLAMDALTLDAGGDIHAQAIDVGTFTLAGGSWTQVGATLPGFQATDFRLSGGTFLRALGGDGSAANPYQLTDVYGLQGLDSTSLLGGHFALANDIDASATSGWNSGAGFDPIADVLSSIDFTGVFDGLGHVITGLTIYRPTGFGVGLFSEADNGVLRNVGLQDVSITGWKIVGGLAGVSRGTITQSWVTGTVSGDSFIGGLVALNDGWIRQSWAGATVNGDRAGGLVGATTNGSIDQSWATGAVSGPGDAGGLVGRSDRGTITRSYATGAVSSAAGSAGGLVGSTINESITESSYATGAVSSATGSAGGLVGNDTDGTFTDSYWDTETTGQTIGIGNDPVAVGVAGLTTADLIAALPTGFDTTVWGNANNQTTPFLIGLAGNRVFNVNDATTATSAPNLYTVIQDVDQLQAMEGDLGERYLLGNDIDASATASWNPAGSGGFSGFDPIGTHDNADPTVAFTGHFDGLGHTVTGLFINRPSASFVGLFGSAGNSSTIRNIGLLGGSVSGGYYVGGLAGHSDGSISQAYNTGAVTGYSEAAGGLVGWNDLGTISQAHASGTVSGESHVGGLVGFNNSTISDVYATGTVNAGVGSYQIGGLAGFNGGTIDRAYATGQVNGVTFVGGLAGYNMGTINYAYATGQVNGVTSVGGLAGYNGGTIDQTYATGKVDGTTDTGGLIGTNAAILSGNVSRSYWDTDTTGQSIGEGYGNNISDITGGCMSDSCANGGTVDLSQQSTFVGWDLATTGGSGAVWRIYEGHTAPLLRAFMTGLQITTDDVVATYNGTAHSGSTAFTLDQLLPTYWLPSTTVDPGLVLGAATSSSPAVNVGSYVLDGSGLYSSQLGYDLAVTNGSLTINPATLTISTSDVSKVYDGTTVAAGTAVAAAGTQLFGTDSLSGGSFAFDDKNAGTGKTVTTSAVTVNDGNGGNNYTVTYADNTNGTINPFVVDLSGSRVYDGTTAVAAGIFTLGALTGTETLTLTGTGTVADKNVASGKAVTLGTLALGDGSNGGLAGNYTLIGGSQTADITQLGITVDATAADKVYDGTTTATAALASSGILAGDTVSFSGAGTFDDKNVGVGKTVTVAGIAASGADVGNYSFNTTASDTADISQLGITIDATAADKVYDGTTAATAALASNGVIAGDDIVFDQAGATFDDKNAGTGKTVTVDRNSDDGTDAGYKREKNTATRTD
jgi:hypothetical protein